MITFYTEEDLTSFGNYLLSKTRKDRTSEVNHDKVTHADAANWRDEIGQSEQLKAEVFTLANKLALAGEGDAAVAMHMIHNRL